jgi:hypothetical protein
MVFNPYSDDDFASETEEDEDSNHEPVAMRFLPEISIWLAICSYHDTLGFIARDQIGENHIAARCTGSALVAHRNLYIQSYATRLFIISDTHNYTSYGPRPRLFIR